MARKKRLSAKKCHYVFLKTLNRLKPDERRDLMDRLTDKTVNDLSEVIFNGLKTDVGFSKTQKQNLKRKLNPFKRQLRIISNSDISLNTRRKVLKNQSGAGIGVIISALLPVISSLIANKLSK